MDSRIVAKRLPPALPGSICRNRNQRNAIYGADNPATQPGRISGGKTTGEGGSMVEKVYRGLALTNPAAGIARMGEAVTKDHQAGRPGCFRYRASLVGSCVVAPLASRQHCRSSNKYQFRH